MTVRIADLLRSASTPKTIHSAARLWMPRERRCGGVRRAVFRAGRYDKRFRGALTRMRRDAPTDDLRICAKPQTVEAAHLGVIRSVVLTNLGAELICEHGTLILSVEQWFEFVKYRKPA